MRIEDTSSSYTNKLNLVLSARAHPGEPQASHHMKGMIDWILSSDETASILRQKVRLDIFPMINPDGVYSGRLRALNDGTDGNRGWSTSGPSSSLEPKETFLIHSKMHELRNETDYGIDLHSSNWTEPRVTEFTNTSTDWSSADKTAIMNALNALDSSDYWYDTVYDYSVSYSDNYPYRYGQHVQYGYKTLISEGGIYTDNSGTYPTAATRQTGGANFLNAFITVMEEAVVGATTTTTTTTTTTIAPVTVHCIFGGPTCS